MKISKRFIAGLVIINGLIYGLNTFYNCFVPLYLAEYHSPSGVGIIIAAASLVAIIAPILWGIAADRAKYKNSVLLTSVILSAIAFYALSFGHSFAYLLIAMMVLMAVMSPFPGLVDTITMEYSKSSGMKYGPVRNTGTIVYAVIGIWLSLIAGESMKMIFPAFIGVAAVCAAGIMMSPKVEGHSHDKAGFDIRPLLRYKKLFVIFAMLGLAMFGWGFYSNFFPAYMTQTLGLPQWIWGVNIAVTVALEIPFFIWFDKVFDRFGIKGVLLYTSVMTVLRCFMLAFFHSAAAILLTGLLTGPAITITMYCASVYINRYIPDELKATGQNVNQALPCGGMRVVAALTGGFMSERIGIPGSMIVCGIMALAMLALWLIFIMPDRSGELDGVKKSDRD